MHVRTVLRGRRRPTDWVGGGHGPGIGPARSRVTCQMRCQFSLCSHDGRVTRGNWYDSSGTLHATRISSGNLQPGGIGAVLKDVFNFLFPDCHSGELCRVSCSGWGWVGECSERCDSRDESAAPAMASTPPAYSVTYRTTIAARGR